MGFEDAVRGEKENRELNDRYRKEEAARWAQGAADMGTVLQEFLNTMGRAGNPGLRTFKQRRGKPDSIASDFLPARQIRGWAVGHGTVITPDGRILIKFLDRDEVANAPSRELGRAFQHGQSIDGKSYGPYSAEEIRQVLAPVLMDAGAVK